ncbi:MAG: hypothetical protein ABI983_09490 [Acidobacteriota bacterium]
MGHSVFTRKGQRLRGFLVGCTALLLLAPPAFADDQKPSATESTAQSSAPPPDFMLGRPHLSFGVKGSWFMASTGSDFYETVTKTLTLEKSNFHTGTFSFEGGFNVHPRLEITGTIDLNRLNQPSEDRENHELLSNGTFAPIRQTTELAETNFTGSAKFLLIPRGRSISKLAWIPNTIVPFVGAGAGIGKYNLSQDGDFVDYSDLHIFTDTFHSEGWSPVVHVFGGTDVQIQRHIILSFEGRYTWQHADLSADFVNFDAIELGGLRFGGGVHFAF